MKERLPFRPTTPLTPPEHGKEAVVGRKGRPGRKTLTPLIIPSKGKELQAWDRPGNAAVKRTRDLFSEKYSFPTHFSG